MRRIQVSLFAVLAVAGLSSEAAALVSAQGFGAEINISQVVGSRVSFADLDGDGHVDVLGGSLALTWRAGRGDGRFDGGRRVGPLDLFTNFGTAFAKGVDMDGDGDIDIALSRDRFPAPGYLAWQENLASGEFGPLEVLFQLTVPVRETLGVDLNGDGLSDFVVLQDDGQVGWYETLAATGSHGVGLGPFEIITAPDANVRALRAGDVDVDGDGDFDLVSLRGFANSLPTQLQYSENLGGGTFAPVRISNSASRSSGSLALADMDLDGDLDAVLPSSLNNGVYWHRNDGAGWFPVRQLVGVLGSEAQSVYASDLDQDGDVDVLVGTVPASGGVHWFKAEPGGSFLPSVSLFPDQNVTSDGNLGSDDLNGDGVPDPWCNSGVVQWVDGAVSSAQWAIEGLGPTAIFPMGHCAFDFEGDGDQDLAVTTFSGLYAWINDGDASFKDSVQLAAFSSDSAPVALDVDDDGDDDLVTVQGEFEIPRGVYLSENLGGGQFAPRRALDVDDGDSDPTILAADLEGDGDVDLYVVYRSGPTRWLVNDGAGSFAILAVADPPVGPPFARVMPVDLDEDGALEFLAVESQPSRDCMVVTREWRSTGSVSDPQVLVTFAAGCNQLQGAGLGDVNADGILDLVVHNPDLGTIDSMNGLGGGAFAAPVPLLMAMTEPLEMEVLDVNLDGMEDILGFSEEAAYWYAGLGQGVFTAGERYQQGALINRVGPVNALDFDGDGDADLLKASPFPILQLNTTRIGRRSCADQDPSSSGLPGTLWAEGSIDLTAGALILQAARLPVDQFGIFLVAPMTGFVPNPGGGLGTLCLGGAVGRFNRPSEVRFTGSTGTASLTLDFNSIPTPLGSELLQPGDTRFFQFWFRDRGPGSSANLTAALELQFR